MAKKKKKGKPQANPAKAQPLNAPFAGLGRALKDAAPPQPEQPPAPEPETEPLDDAEAFAQAMRGVEQLDRASGPQVTPGPSDARPLITAEPDEELEVLAELADLVSGKGRFDLSLTAEYVTGSWSGVSPELMERLKLGQFPIQDHLDLHGMAVDEALASVEEFLVQSQSRGLRHVLLVHGKGMGSPEGVPVLKRALIETLGAKRLGKRVLAFCSAQAFDGGVGAMYVLLRKWRGPGSFS